MPCDPLPYLSAPAASPPDARAASRSWAGMRGELLCCVLRRSGAGLTFKEVVAWRIGRSRSSPSGSCAWPMENCRGPPSTRKGRCRTPNSPGQSPGGSRGRVDVRDCGGRENSPQREEPRNPRPVAVGRVADRDQCRVADCRRHRPAPLRRREQVNARRGGTIIGATVATWAMHGSLPMPSASRSAAVKMPRTPGIARAAAVSMPSIAACPCGERSTMPCSWPGRSMSST
jgi:hypothetical protein